MFGNPLPPVNMRVWPRLQSVKLAVSRASENLSEEFEAEFVHAPQPWPRMGYDSTAENQRPPRMYSLWTPHAMLDDGVGSVYADDCYFYWPSRAGYVLVGARAYAWGGRWLNHETGDGGPVCGAFVLACEAPDTFMNGLRFQTPVGHSRCCWFALINSMTDLDDVSYYPAAEMIFSSYPWKGQSSFFPFNELGQERTFGDVYGFGYNYTLTPRLVPP